MIRNKKEEFIEKLGLIQPNLKLISEYKNCEQKVLIEDSLGICYLSTPFKLLQGRTPSMSSAIDKNKAFETKSREIHNNKYNYSLVEYKGATEKVLITCPNHGMFQQSPSGHLSGKECKRCAEEKSGAKRRMSHDEFVKKSKNKHGENFEYLSKYVNGSTKVKLRCKKHNITYLTMPYSHIRGAGCDSCKREKISKAAKEKNYGWAKSDWVRLCNSKENSNPKIYLIKCFNENEEFIKIGRTMNDIKIRFPGKREMPYEYEVLETI